MKTRFGIDQANADDAAADKLLEDMAKGIEGGPPAPPAPAPAPGPAPAPVIAPPVPPVASPIADANEQDLVIEALKESLAESKHKESIALGRLKVAADENKILRTNTQKLETRVTELEKAKPTTPALAPEVVTPARVKTLQDDFGLDEASAQRFDTTIQDAISAGVSAQLKAMGIKPGEQTPPPVEAPAAPPVVASPAADESTLMSDADMNLLKRLVPNLDAILNYDAKGNAQGSPELDAFFAQVDPKAKLSIGAMAQQAVADKDPVRLAAIYNEFKAIMAKQGKPIRPLAPHTGPGGGPGALDNDKPQYSLKEAEAFMKNYQKNIGNYSPEELQAAQAKLEEYEQAGLEGRLI